MARRTSKHASEKGFRHNVRDPADLVDADPDGLANAAMLSWIYAPKGKRTSLMVAIDMAAGSAGEEAKSCALKLASACHNPGWRDEHGMDALMRAARQGLADVCQILMGHPGIDPDVVDKDGFDAARWAALGRHFDLAAEILAWKERRCPGSALRGSPNHRVDDVRKIARDLGAGTRGLAPIDAQLIEAELRLGNPDDAPIKTAPRQRL